MNPELVKKRNEFDKLKQIISNIFEEAGESLDMSKVSKFGAEDVSRLTDVQKSHRVKALNDKLGILRAEVDRLAKNEGPGFSMIHPGVSGDFGRQSGETLGQRIVKDAGFLSWRKNGAAGDWGKSYDELSFKALFETGAGWAPESLRIPGVVEKETRPLQVVDLVPFFPTAHAKIVYMEETTRTHSAAEKAEGTAYAESTFALTEKESDVRKITDSLPVTDEQLEDVAGAEAYIDQRLMFGVRQRLDNQIINGDGISPNLKGVLNVAGIQTQAKGADPAIDAIHKAITKVRVTGRSEPTAIVIHPTNWEALRLTKTADGIYIFGNPSEKGATTIFGLKLVVGDVIAAGTALVGSFLPQWVGLYERRGVTVTVGTIGSQFTEGKKTIRAEGRWGFVVRRPQAFCTVTGL